jgi:hypothetical protein
VRVTAAPVSWACVSAARPRARGLPRGGAALDPAVLGLPAGLDRRAAGDGGVAGVRARGSEEAGSPGSERAGSAARGRGGTHARVGVLNERVAAGPALERPGRVEEEVELGDAAEFREDEDERVFVRTSFAFGVSCAIRT